MYKLMYTDFALNWRHAKKEKISIKFLNKFSYKNKFVWVAAVYRQAHDSRAEYTAVMQLKFSIYIYSL